MTHYTSKSIVSISAALLLLSPFVQADQTTSYTYNAMGLVETVNGPRIDVSDITTFGYDVDGNRNLITNALGHVTQITAFDASGRPLTLIDPNGAITSLSYDPRGRLESIDTEGRLMQLSYDAAGNINQITQANGVTLTYHYDSAHRPTGYSDSLGNSVNYGLDDAGNHISETITDPNQLVQRNHVFIYDELNRLIFDLGSEAQTAAHEYDLNGNVTGQTDPNNNSTQFAFDALDNLIDATDADLGQTSYSYDGRDNLTSVTDAEGLVTLYSYDEFDDLIQQDSPDTGITTYSYDDAGNRLTQIDARGITTSYTYDALNRLLTVSYPDTSLNVTYTYDENNLGQNGVGRLTKMVDASGITEYSYDLRGNLLSALTTRDTVMGSIQYAYNGADQLIQMTYPSGVSINYDHDVLGRVSAVTLVNGVTLVDNIQYLPFGPMSSVSHANGLTSNYSYDLGYRLTDIDTTDKVERNYGFDPASNITAITDNLDVANNQDFLYDNINRLEGAQSTYGDLLYQYDLVGNRTQRTDGITTDNYNYAIDSHHLQDINNTQTYSYDANGNTLTSPNIATNLVYGDHSRLSQVNGMSYTYNGSGERVIKANGNSITWYHYDQNGQLIAETDNNGNTQKQYVYVNGQLLTMIQDITTIPIINLTMDNTDASFIGFWGSGTTISGYQGSNYQQHAGSASSGPDLLGSPIDNTDSGFSTNGSWTAASAIGGYLGSNYQTLPAGTGNNVATWTPNLPTKKQRYDVYVNWVSDNNNASNATYTITQANGKIKTKTVNQQQGGGQWQLLGTYQLKNTNTIRLSDDANGIVIADSLTLLPAGTTPTVITQIESATWIPNQSGDYDIYATWPADSSNASNGQYTINHTNGSNIVTVDQQQNGNQWNLLGTYTLNSSSTITLDSNANGSVIADGIGLLASGAPSSTESASFHVHNDHLGTPQSITDINQDVVWEADFNPFGKATVSTNTITNNIRFPGQYYDAETGLHYNYFRYYDPSIGRYITSDPIGLAGGINTYAYVGGNPINWSDRLGLDTIFVGGNIRIPTTVINLVLNTNIESSGGSAGFAISFPGVYGGEFDLGGYFTGEVGGGDIGTGKAGFELGYGKCSVKDMAGEGASMGFNDGIGGLTLDLDASGNTNSIAIEIGPGVNAHTTGTLTTTISIRHGVQY